MQNNNWPKHYCPDCGADSLYAPTNPDHQGYRWQAYTCGSLLIYRPDWTSQQRFRCGTFLVRARHPRFHSGLNLSAAAYSERIFQVARAFDSEVF